MITRLLRPMTGHPASVGETYLEHFLFAARFGLLLLAAAIAAMIHALFPFMFEKTASRIVGHLYVRTRFRGSGQHHPTAIDSQTEH